MGRALCMVVISTCISLARHWHSSSQLTRLMRRCSLMLGLYMQPGCTASAGRDLQLPVCSLYTIRLILYLPPKGGRAMGYMPEHVSHASPMLCPAACGWKRCHVTRGASSVQCGKAAGTHQPGCVRALGEAGVPFLCLFG